MAKIKRRGGGCAKLRSRKARGIKRRLISCYALRKMKDIISVLPTLISNAASHGLKYVIPAAAAAAWLEAAISPEQSLTDCMSSSIFGIVACHRAAI